MRAIAWEFVQTVLLTLAIFAIVNLTTARVRVIGPSMQPTFRGDGSELIIVSRLSYVWDAPQRGDVVVLRMPASGREDLIKRVVGLPGEKVQIVGGHVWVNGEPLEESYAVGLTSSDQSWELAADQLFVLGDNRAFSRDSHSFGPISLDELVGQAWLIYWPPTEWGLIDQRTAAASAAPSSP
ncbi:MAG: signal peptidase I [Chloroflexi bacterium RBG_16_64_43]|nr:MAG: signal peptidase I [Chloroflexi bacterium RBG_16_64_43]